MIFKTKLKSSWHISSSDGQIRALPACVPGYVTLDLVREGILQNPYTGIPPFEKLEWIAENDWTYTTTFNLPDHALGFRNRALLFEGIDTVADIFVNGEKKAHTENMFLPVVVPLEKENTRFELEVRIKGTKRAGKEKEELYGEITGQPFYRWRSYLRKAQYQSEWDWLLKAPSVGIWKEVHIVGYDSLLILNHGLKIEYDEKEKKATLMPVLDVLLEEDPLPVALDIEITAPDGKKFTFSRNEITLKNGVNTLEPLRIEDPLLWYPKGYGKQNLYTFEITLYHRGIPQDRVRFKFGIRDVKFREDGFGLKVNGIPVKMWGFNWIPFSGFPSELHEDGYRNLLNILKDSPVNSLRVWGGGIYESELFYQICDELGIMVSQDYMFACSMYPEHPEFTESVKEEAIRHTMRISRHPSVVLLYGDNENESGYGRNRSGAKFSEKILPEIANEFFPQALYWRSSPAREGNLADDHIWDPLGKLSPEMYEKFPSQYVSEFGWLSFPHGKTLKMLTGDPEVLKLSMNEILESDAFEILASHSKWGGEGKEEESLRKAMMKVASFFGEESLSLSLENFALLTQIYHGLALKKGIEFWRVFQQFRHGYTTNGILVWQYDDAWPAISWAVVDYLFQKKLVYGVLENLFMPVLCVVSKEGKIFLKNDTPSKKNVLVEVLSYDMTSGEAQRNEFETEVEKESIVEVNSIQNVNQKLVLVSWKFLEGKEEKNGWNFAVGEAWFKRQGKNVKPIEAVEIKIQESGEITLLEEKVAPFTVVFSERKDAHLLFFVPGARFRLNFVPEKKAISFFGL